MAVHREGSHARVTGNGSEWQRAPGGMLTAAVPGADSELPFPSSASAALGPPEGVAAGRVRNIRTSDKRHRTRTRGVVRKRFRVVDRDTDKRRPDLLTSRVEGLEELASVRCVRTKAPRKLGVVSPQALRACI